MSRRIISTATTMLIALIMAVLVWVAAVREENPITAGIYPQPIPLKVIPPIEGIVLTQDNIIPANIQVRLRAPQNSWQQLTQNSFEAKLDLSQYPIGWHEAEINVTVADEQVVVEEVFPTRANIQLEAMATKRMPLIIRLTGDPPAGFAYRLPREPITMTITGPESGVKEVERVEVQMFLNNVRESVQREVRAIPKNLANETVNGVTIDPLRPTIGISVEQKFGYNTVSVQAKVVGEPASGYFINSISTEPKEILLRGLDTPPSSLETGEIDISGTTEDVVKRVPVTIPPGFTVDLEDGRSILVTVEIAAFNGSLRVERSLTMQGAASDLVWEVDPKTVDILLKGPVPILQNLLEEDVTVIVDLFELAPGVHRLVPTIIKPEELEVGSVIPDTIEVAISLRPQIATPIPFRPTPRPMPTLPSITTTIVSSTTDTLTNTKALTSTFNITKTDVLTNSLHLTGTTILTDTFEFSPAEIISDPIELTGTLTITDSQ